VGRAILSIKTTTSYSIERTATLSVIAIVVLVTFVVFSGLYLVAANHLQDRFDAILMARAKTIMSLVELDQDGLDHDYSEDVLPEFTAETASPFFLQVRHADESEFIRSSSLGHADLAWTADITTEDEPVIENVTLPDGQPGRQISIAFLPRVDVDGDEDEAEIEAGLLEQDRPVLRMIIAYSRSELNHALYVLLSTLVGAALVMALILVIGIGRVVRRGLEPLREGSRQIESLDASDLSARINLSQLPQEMVPIVDALNSMLARLEAAFVRESRFSADVAHELRTPLAELASASAVARTLPDGDPAIRMFFSDVVDVTEQMSTMVEILLTLARYENETLDLPRTTVDLRSVLEKAAADITAARDEPPSIRIVSPMKALVSTHADGLHIILRNLLSNAVQYSPSGNEIVCTIEPAASGIRIAITNSAPELMVSDLETMFERFWQGDHSRTSATNFGLGLPLVKTLCDALGMALEATLQNGQLTMTIAGFGPVAAFAEPVAAE
jgi:signal transduction histidine kinase